MAARKKKTGKNNKAIPMGTLAATVPRAARGRTGAATTPVFIRGPVGHDGTLDADAVRKKLGTQLGRYAERIDRLDVVFRVENGTKGAPATTATIEVKMPRLDPVAVSVTSDASKPAFIATVRAAERAIRRQLERRRSARTAAAR